MRTGIATMVILAAVAATACSSSGGKSATTPVKLQPVTVTEKTPQACLDALDTAETVFSTAADGFTVAGDTIGNIVPDAFTAIENSDVAGINDAADRIKANTAKITDLGTQVTDEHDLFNSQAAECRAAG